MDRMKFQILSFVLMNWMEKKKTWKFTGINLTNYPLKYAGEGMGVEGGQAFLQ